MLTVLALIWRQTSQSGARAQALLREVLSEEERHLLYDTGFLDVPSASDARRTYQIPLNGGRVRVREGAEVIMELCVQPTSPLPPLDLVILHKLLLETDEAAYLAVANKFSPQRIPFFGPAGVMTIC